MIDKLLVKQLWDVLHDYVKNKDAIIGIIINNQTFLVQYNTICSIASGIIFREYEAFYDYIKHHEKKYKRLF